MAEFFVGEFGPARPLEVTMPFDPTAYTTTSLEITRPDKTKITTAPSSQGATFVRFSPLSSSWPHQGAYEVLIRCFTATNERRARAKFTVVE